MSVLRTDKPESLDELLKSFDTTVKSPAPDVLKLLQIKDIADSSKINPHVDSLMQFIAAKANVDLKAMSDMANANAASVGDSNVQ